MNLSQIAFASGACGGLAKILVPCAVSTASKELMNWPALSLIRNLTVAARWSKQDLADGWEPALTSHCQSLLLPNIGPCPTVDTRDSQAER